MFFGKSLEPGPTNETTSQWGFWGEGDDETGFQLKKKIVRIIPFFFFGFTEATYYGQPLPERMILSNTYELLINGQWQKQTDLEHVSLKDTINHPDLPDVYTDSIWEFAQDMYYKQSKKDEHGYEFGTVNVLPNQSQKRLAEIEQCYDKARDWSMHTTNDVGTTRKHNYISCQIVQEQRVNMNTYYDGVSTV